LTRERRETLSAPLAHARSRFPPTQHKKAQHSLRLFTARKPFLAQHCTWWAIKFTQLKAKTRAACLGNISFDAVSPVQRLLTVLNEQRHQIKDWVVFSLIAGAGIVNI
jgi:hypothetical protein